MKKSIAIIIITVCVVIFALIVIFIYKKEQNLHITPDGKNTKNTNEKTISSSITIRILDLKNRNDLEVDRSQLEFEIQRRAGHFLLPNLAFMNNKNIQIGGVTIDNSTLSFDLQQNNSFFLMVGEKKWPLEEMEKRLKQASASGHKVKINDNLEGIIWESTLDRGVLTFVKGDILVELFTAPHRIVSSDPVTQVHDSDLLEIARILW